MPGDAELLIQLLHDFNLNISKLDLSWEWHLKELAIVFVLHNIIETYRPESFRFYEFYAKLRVRTLSTHCSKECL